MPDEFHPIFLGMQTIENTREKDVTMIAPEDADVEADDADDEFASACCPRSSQLSCSLISPVSKTAVVRIAAIVQCAQSGEVIRHAQATSIESRRPMCFSPPATDLASLCSNSCQKCWRFYPVPLSTSAR